MAENKIIVVVLGPLFCSFVVLFERDHLEPTALLVRIRCAGAHALSFLSRSWGLLRGTHCGTQWFRKLFKNLPAVHLHQEIKFSLVYQQFDTNLYFLDQSTEPVWDQIEICPIRFQPAIMNELNRLFPPYLA